MSDGEHIGGEVVPLFGIGDEGDDGNPVLRKPFDHSHSCAGFCKRTELDSKTERAYCRDCKREVPLFKVLMTLAHASGKYIAARKEAERRSRLAQGRLDELLRLERNAKGRLRRASVPRVDIEAGARVGERNARAAS